MLTPARFRRHRSRPAPPAFRSGIATYLNYRWRRRTGPTIVAR